MDNFKRALGEKIKARRKELGYLTQEALADELGVDRSRVSKWESGAEWPETYLDELQRILKVEDAFFTRSLSQSSEKIKLQLISLILGLNDDAAAALFEQLSLGTGEFAFPIKDED